MRTLHTFNRRRLGFSHHLNQFVQEGERVADSIQLAASGHPSTGLPNLEEFLAAQMKDLPTQHERDIGELQTMLRLGQIRAFLNRATGFACGLSGRDVSQAGATAFGSWEWSCFDIPDAPAVDPDFQDE